MSGALHTVIRSLFERVQEHERRLAGSKIRGKVREVDAAKAKVRLLIGKNEEGGDVLSPWIPYQQTAGSLKVHSAPSVDQSMYIQSETGDIRQGTAVPYHWNQDNEDPSDKQEEHILTFGNAYIRLREDDLEITMGDSTVLLETGGITLTAPRIDHFKA